MRVWFFLLICSTVSSDISHLGNLIFTFLQVEMSPGEQGSLNRLLFKNSSLLSNEVRNGSFSLAFSFLKRHSLKRIKYKEIGSWSCRNYWYLFIKQNGYDQGLGNLAASIFMPSLPLAHGDPQAGCVTFFVITISLTYNMGTSHLRPRAGSIDNTCKALKIVLGTLHVTPKWFSYYHFFIVIV